jgi:dolichol-phosphate mannosyltransferase
MIYILLPAYNEEKTLDAFLPKVDSELQKLNEDHQIILMDDGSTDGTLQKAEGFKKTISIEVLRHPTNRGLGETIRDLFEYATIKSSPDDILIRMDCDDTHDPQYIPGLIRKIRQGYDVAICSRFPRGGGQRGVSSWRGFISRCAQWYARLLFHVPAVREYSCGYRAYRASVIQHALSIYGNSFIQLKGVGFTCTLEKLVKLSMLGARFGEIPFVLRYDQKVSESKMLGSVTTLGYLMMALLYHWPWGGWRCNRSLPHPNSRGRHWPFPTKSAVSQRPFCPTATRRS